MDPLKEYINELLWMEKKRKTAEDAKKQLVKYSRELEWIEDLLRDIRQFRKRYNEYDYRDRERADRRENLGH